MVCEHKSCLRGRPAVQRVRVLWQRPDSRNCMLDGDLGWFAIVPYSRLVRHATARLLWFAA